MRKTLLTIGMGLAVSSATIFTSVAQQSGAAALRGHVPAAVARLQPNGRLSATTEMKLAIGLPLRNQGALTNLLQQLYDPSSPNYQHYLTPEEFTAQFGPTEQDYQKVVAFARANGLTVTRTHGNRMLVDVSGNVADIEKAFHVTMRTYRHPTEARNFFAPDVEPSRGCGRAGVAHQRAGQLFHAASNAALRPASKAKPALGSAPVAATWATISGTPTSRARPRPVPDRRSGCWSLIGFLPK